MVTGQLSCVMSSGWLTFTHEALCASCAAFLTPSRTMSANPRRSEALHAFCNEENSSLDPDRKPRRCLIGIKHHPCAFLVDLLTGNFTQLTSELFGRLAARDQISIVDDHGGNGIYSAATPQRLV